MIAGARIVNENNRAFSLFHVSVFQYTGAAFENYISTSVMRRSDWTGKAFELLNPKEHWEAIFVIL